MSKRFVSFLLFALVDVLDSAFAYGEQYVPFTKPHTTYIVNTVIDLKGETVNLPEECTLVIRKKGCLKNGTLKGNDTRIKVKKRKCHFRDIIISGTWKAPKVYGEWFDFQEGINNTTQIKNVFSLCSSDIINEVYFQEGTYYVDNYDEELNSPAVIRIPSKTRIHSKASFHVRPGSHNQSFVFCFFGVSDCVWDGGRIIGDLENHIGEDGEQGFGIALRGAQYITIRNVECLNCWGDGINLQYGGAGKHNENVYISNVICSGNRRQGISIEDGINIKVVNSLFRNTGIHRGTSPKFGIDIEPCYSEAIIRHIMISDCEFDNNVGGGVSCCFIKPTDADIRIINCLDNGGGLLLCGCDIDIAHPGISVDRYRCEYGKLMFRKNVQNVEMTDCYFQSAFNQEVNEDVLSHMSFDNLCLRTNEKRTWNYYCLSLICKSLEDLTFKNCSFEILENSTLSAVLPSGGDWTGVHMSNCVIIDNRECTIFIPCDIEHSKIDSGKSITFVNCKKREALQFYSNRVVVRGKMEDTSILFMNVNKGEYELIGNDIFYSGNIDGTDIFNRNKVNNINPIVRHSKNTFHKIL